METSVIIEALLQLNQNNPIDCQGDIIQLLECNIHSAHDIYNIGYHEIKNALPVIISFNPEDKSVIWSYIITNLYYLNQLKANFQQSVEHNDLNLQDRKLVFDILTQFTGIAIRCNLLPNLPKYLKHSSESFYNEENIIMMQYKRLNSTCYAILELLKCPILKHIIIVDTFQILLNGLYQIIYCPVRKADDNIKDKFVMTHEIYEKLMQDKNIFKEKFQLLYELIPTNIFAKETMLLLQNNKTRWFKAAVSANLTHILRSPKGLEIISVSLLETITDYNSLDSTKSWKALDILIKLVMSLKKSNDFESNICKQVADLLLLETSNGEQIEPFELIFLMCTKTLFNDNKDARCTRDLLSVLLNPLINLTNITYKYEDGADITEILLRTIRLLHSGFLGNNVNDPDLPLNILTPVLNVLFKLYAITSFSSSQSLQFNILNKQSQQIIIAYLEKNKDQHLNTFDALFFSIPTQHILPLRSDIELLICDERIVITYAKVKQHCFIRCDFLSLFKEKNELLMSFFIYLLNSLSNKSKYFKNDSNYDVVQVEPELLINESIERNLVVYNLLASLSENKSIQTYINANPKEIIDYINSSLESAIASRSHITKRSESDTFQFTFQIIMIVQALVMNCTAEQLKQYYILKHSLQVILTESNNEELRQLVSSIAQLLEETNGINCNKDSNELEQAILDVCDPLLPVRGHGIMALAKLVEKKDPNAIDRKMYILNIFLQNIKNEDTFIYLAAIKGLSEMGDIFPDIVLHTLTEEYSDLNRKSLEDNIELRLKLGEVLVQVIKKLGDDATKYRSLLLNTFLISSKDDDHLIRASSLSNLGEICRVLGYKLGSIVAEVLECVHDIITTDNAVEARRAAVTVIRELFAGLESEMVTFLKDEILEIYRSLKNIYRNDNDDVMRLQAQLALEELNSNVMKFLNNPKLKLDNKFVLKK